MVGSLEARVIVSLSASGESGAHVSTVFEYYTMARLNARPGMHSHLLGPDLLTASGVSSPAAAVHRCHRRLRLQTFWDARDSTAVFDGIV